MIETAIILAGGKGTRLRSVVSDRPKPMAEIKGKPFLSYLLQDLADQGIHKCLLSVGYGHQHIMDYFGTQFQHISLQYVVESRALGTGGAIKNCMEQLNDLAALVVNGDTRFRIDIQAFFRFFESRNGPLSVALKPMEDAGRYGRVQLDEQDRIVAFQEKGQRVSGLINGGLYLLKRSLFSQRKFPESFSFETEILQKLYTELPFFGQASDAYFIDIGIPEDYARAQEEFGALQA